MTPDTLVGGVPNTTATRLARASPTVRTRTASWGCRSVGATSTTSPTPATTSTSRTCADGTYWLRAQADPDGYFTGGGTDQSVTDTELQITGHDREGAAAGHAGHQPAGGHHHQPGRRRRPSRDRPPCRRRSPTRPTVTSLQFFVDGSAVRGADHHRGHRRYSVPVASLPARPAHHQRPGHRREPPDRDGPGRDASPRPSRSARSRSTSRSTSTGNTSATTPSFSTVGGQRAAAGHGGG